MQGKMRQGYIEASTHDPQVDETNKKKKEIVIIEIFFTKVCHVSIGFKLKLIQLHGRYMEHGVDNIPELEDEDKEEVVEGELHDRHRVHLDVTYKSELYDDFLEDLKQQAADNGTEELQVSNTYFLRVLRGTYKVLKLNCDVLSGVVLCCAVLT